MLLLGMTFPATLQLLLPISLMISLLQLSRDHEHVDRVILRRVLAFTLPAIGLALWATTYWSPPLEGFVAILVLIFSLQDRVILIRNRLNQILKFQRSYFAVMGFVHGASNLGGSMLTALVFGTGLGKNVVRATIAAGYTLFATVQLITLYLAGVKWEIDFGNSVGVMVSGAAIFWITECCIYRRFDSKRYHTGLEVLLVITGLLLIISALQS